MRTRLLLAGILLIGALCPSGAQADLPPDDRRARDTFWQWSVYDDDGDHNHFHIVLHRDRRYPERPNGDYTNAVTAVRVTTYTPLYGVVIERVYEATVGDSSAMFPGRGGFAEGPCYPCGPYGTLFFALPTVFGEAETIVDIELALLDAAGDCATAGLRAPCGGTTSAYFNPGYVGLPNPFDTDAGDAIPEPIALH